MIPAEFGWGTLSMREARSVGFITQNRRGQVVHRPTFTTRLKQGAKSRHHDVPWLTGVLACTAIVIVVRFIELKDSTVLKVKP